VLVEGGLGDAGAGDDLIDADGAKAVAVEEINGGGDEAVAAGLGGAGRPKISAADLRGAWGMGNSV